VVVIRAGSAADAAQIAAVQREGWFAAYEGIIPAEIIDRVTAPDGGARVRQSFRTRPWQRMLVAVGAEREHPGTAGVAAGPGVVGYASFGPETDVLSAPWPHPLSTDGEDGRVAELYALWVLRDNQRARRFYKQAGFTPDGAANVLSSLGNVIEVRYRRTLDPEFHQEL
jgi:hypothetical protein